MSDPPRYLSKKWIDAARRRVESIPDLAEVVGGVSLSLLMVVTDRPGLDGEAIYIEFDEGDLKHVKAGGRDAFESRYDETEFTVWASYDTFAEIHAGRLNEKMAVLSGRIHLKGSMFRALKLLKIVEKLNAILRQEPARY